jgi:TIR domain
MKTLAFINYRRSDVLQAAQGLYAQLRTRFGPSHVFMDVGVILPGAQWPERLRRALDEASVMLTVIGPRWLTAADQYGQRRLDKSDDWVRNEIVHALNCGKPIFPLLVAGADSMPPLEGTPAELHGLLNHQKVQLRDEKWDHDLNELVHVLETTHGFVGNQKPVALPQPEVKIEPLNESQMDTALSTLSGWQPVESMIPGDYPIPGKSFGRPIGSIHSKAQFSSCNRQLVRSTKCDIILAGKTNGEQLPFISTWDIGNKVSELDIELARTLDALYERVTANPGKKSKAPKD